MDIKKLIFAFRSIGIGNIIRSIHYSFQRDQIERKFPQKLISSTDAHPGDCQNIVEIESGSRIKFEHASVDLQFLSPCLIKTSWEPGKSPLPYTIEKVNLLSQQPTIVREEGYYALSTDQVRVIIRKTGSIEFQDHNNNTLRYDQPPVRNGESWQLITHLKPEEHIYGLGERITSLNLRPGSYMCWNRDVGGSYSPGTDPLYLGTPIYLSLSYSGSYLVYFENSYKSRFTFDEQASVTFDGGTLRYYIIIGSLSSIFQQLSELVGKPFFAPRWALGYHQSRWGYRTEEDIYKVIHGFEEHDLPLSAIHLDIDYMNGYRVFSVNQERFPNLQLLTKELDEKGVKVIATINPAVKIDEKYKVFSDGIKKSVFCKSPNGKTFRGVSWPGWSVFPDFIDSKTREWWFVQYQTLINAGISGFWHDMNEPASFAAWGDMSFPSTIIHNENGQTIEHKEAHNLYCLLMNKALYEGMRKYFPEKRPWIFSRAGWAGLQRYAWNWTGDIESSWEAYSRTISCILGLAVSGHASAGVDIGGFSGNPEAELYLRWFQMATFLPLFRTHSALGTKPREPWSFGEPITSIIRSFLNLRYKLLPYFYTAICDTCQTGRPALRPLFWEAPNDQTLWDVDDEFLFGEALLIAPVIEKGAQSRQIILPPGMWYSFWDDQVNAGPSQFRREVSLQTIPIYIKGGSILPMEEDGNLTLQIFPNSNGQTSNHIFSDKGDGYDTWRDDTYQSTHYPDSMQILWETKGDFPFPYSTIKVVLHGKKIHQAIVDGRVIPITGDTIVTSIFRKLLLIFEQ